MLARKAFFGVSLHKASFVCINQEEERLVYLDHLKGNKRAIQDLRNHHKISTESTSAEPVHKDHPLFQPRGSILSTLYLPSFTIRLKFSMITESVPKSSITVDTAFRKDLTLQGCTTLPTCANRLLTPPVKLSSKEGRQRVVDQNLYLTFA
jgi:hypothetical protein